MKNVLKKLIAVVLVVTTLTMLFCISSNAAVIYHQCYYNNNNSNTLEVYLYSSKVNDTTPLATSQLTINNLYVYDIAVFSCGIVGYVVGTTTLTGNYAPLNQAYTNKLFASDYFEMSQNYSTQYKTTSMSNVEPLYGGIVYVAGKSSSTYSSTYDNHFVEIDPYTLMPTYSVYFSNVSSANQLIDWQ